MSMAQHRVLAQEAGVGYNGLTAARRLFTTELCHCTCERLDFFCGVFKDYKPEVPFHNSFQSQLCGMLKYPHSIRKEEGTEFPLLRSLHPSKKNIKASLIFNHGTPKTVITILGMQRVMK